MEVPRHWRLKDFRYGLRVDVDPNGQVSANVPVGVRNFIEGRNEEMTSQESNTVDSMVAMNLVEIANSIK